MKILALLLCLLGFGCATVAPAAPAPAGRRHRTSHRVSPPTQPPESESQAAEALEVPQSPPLEPEPPTDEPPAADVEEGMASFYADLLSGNKTASGERYRPDKRTCAHRTHPFGTWLHITAIDSGRSATCRVNDRGPFAKKRVLDVSKKVAVELGMIAPGVLRVRVTPTTSSDPG